MTETDSAWLDSTSAIDSIRLGLTEMSINIFNRDDGNKQSRYAQIDRNFDAYWEHEARNPNRNRIRIGRQYQATVPPLLKSTQSDDRRLEQLETLRWSPSHPLPDPQLHQYVQVARMLSRLDRPELTADTLATSAHLTCPPTISTSSSASVATATTAASTNDSTSSSTVETNSSHKSQESKTTETSDGSASKSKSKSNVKPPPAELSLARLIAAHHADQSQINCKLTQSIDYADIDPKSNRTNFQAWTPLETALFTQALTICGKNLALIRQQFLPWKSAQSLLDAYYTILNQARQNSSRLDTQDVDAFATFYGRPACLENLPEIGTNHVSTVDDCDVKRNESRLGSLKFYKDGQLVLKLDAKPPVVDRRCRWTEAADSVSRLRPSTGVSGNSIRRKRAEQMRAKANADDPDECRSNGSTNEDEDDADSLDSADACLVPSACLQPPAKRTRVRVENNCHIPIGLSDDHEPSRKDIRSPISPETTSGSSDASDCKRKSRPSERCKSPHTQLSSSPSPSSSSSTASNSSLIPPAAHASSRSLDRLTAASLALDLTRKLASAHPLAAALAESAQMLPTAAAAVALPQCKGFGGNSFESMDFTLGSTPTNSSVTHPFTPAALLNLIKGVDSK
jgi:hypothetical protein